MVNMTTYCSEMRVRTATSFDRVSCSAHFHDICQCFIKKLTKQDHLMYQNTIKNRLLIAN